MMNDAFFYRAFEDRYRGSRETIKTRLEAYLPFIEAAKQAFPAACRALDIGCGRGEWLELLNEQGITAQGVDLDEGMLQACSSIGLSVQQGDGIAYLSQLADNSLELISAFHVVEHISFEQLQTLVSQAMRVLSPGGLLILESPNPENIAVASCSFYMDPTHTKPIPPDLLAFVTEYAGFIQNKILRLQEPKQSALAGSLYAVLHQVSPDYAIVAQKVADTPKLRPFIAAFSHHYGVSLVEKVLAFDQSQAQTINEIVSRMAVAEAQLHDILSSRGWRVIVILRDFKHKLALRWQWFSLGAKSWLTFSPHSRPYRVFRKLVWQTVDYVRAHPRLKNRLVNLLEKMPWLRNRLAGLLIRQRATQEGVIHKNTQLSVPAEAIYQQLDLLKNAPVKTGEQ